MASKKWQQELGAGTATTLRLVEPWFGSGKIIVGDSWFASVKTAVELDKRGLYFIGVVKTATKQFPIKALREKCPEARGSVVYGKATVQNTELICAGWRDKKLHTFVGSCGTTLQGIPAKKQRNDDEGRKYTVEVPRIQMIEEYFDGAPAIDIHNHIRQSGIALEEVWNTQNWKHRMYASLLGIVETNAYLAYKYFKGDSKISHADFTNNLSYQMITKDWSTGTPGNNIQRNEGAQRENADGRTYQGHQLVALSTTTGKQRLQRKCIICRRVRHKQQKASYFCNSCGERAVLCAPTTGRDCNAYHILHGIPT